MNRTVKKKKSLKIRDKRRSAFKNTGLTKISKCLAKIVNIPLKSQQSFLTVLDNILSSQDEKTLERFINSLFDMLTSVPLLSLNENKISLINQKKVKYGSNVLECLRKETHGTYGEINSCNFNGEKMILKKPKYKHLLKKDGSLDLEYVEDQHYDFLKETIIHFMLYCLQKELLGCHIKDDTSKHYCIPEIHSIVTATVSTSDDFSPEQELNNFKTLLVIMERLDYTVNSFIETHLKSDYIVELHLIAMVAYNLFLLQKSLKGFIHRDLHGENIMLKILKNSEATKIKIPTYGIDFEIITNYRTYLIDFGMSCINFDKNVACKSKNIKMPNAKMFISDIYPVKDCKNRSHDLRLFLADIYYHKKKYISHELYVLLEALFIKYETEYENDPRFMLYKQKNTPQFFFYSETIGIEDKLFYPENMLKIVQNELKRKK